MRRIVVGSDASGKSFVSSDDELREPSPRSPFTTIWDADGPLQLPSDGSAPPSGAEFFPPPGGFRILLFTLQPGTAAADGGDEYAQDGPEDIRAATIAGALHIEQDDTPGMHRTDTVDVELVISGEVDLQLDDRVVTLRPGDWVVQNGARHAWVNRTDEPCVLAAIFLGATRS